MLKEITSLINQSLRRKYRSVRLNSHWYSGLPTVDTLGCELRCAPCWLNRSRDPDWIENHGKFYSPEEIAEILQPYPKARISGGEPCLNPEHVYNIAFQIPDTQLLIETTGVDLDEKSIEAFSHLPNVYFRLGFKGVDERSSEITSGRPIFKKQLHTAWVLYEYGCRFHCALIDVFSDPWVAGLEASLPLAIPRSFTKSTSRFISQLTVLELERLSIYPFNRKPISEWLKHLKEEKYTNRKGAI